MDSFSTKFRSTPFFGVNKWLKSEEELAPAVGSMLRGETTNIAYDRGESRAERVAGDV